MKSTRYFKLASAYAKIFSGCAKVSVGSVIERNGVVLSIGANITRPALCKSRGCLRIELYGEDSKAHRNPEDCRAIHSEIDAITKAARAGTSVEGATIYVTRYPCEACARAIVNAGITKVCYGRTQGISRETARIFNTYDVEVNHYANYQEDDTTR